MSIDRRPGVVARSAVALAVAALLGPLLAEYATSPHDAARAPSLDVSPTPAPRSEPLAPPASPSEPAAPADLGVAPIASHEEGPAATSGEPSRIPTSAEQAGSKPAPAEAPGVATPPRPLARTFRVHGRVRMGRAKEDDEPGVPIGGLTVELFFVAERERVDISGRVGAALRVGAAPIEARTVFALAGSRHHDEPMTLATTQTSEDGYFSFAVPADRITEDGELFVVAHGTLDGGRRLAVARHDLFGEVLSGSNDEWDVEALELELLKARKHHLWVTGGGHPVAGAIALFKAEGVAVTTDARGRAELELSVAGELSVTASGFAPAVLDVGVDSPDDVIADLPRPTSVTVLVRDGGGRPIADALVEVDRDGLDAVSGKTDGEGRATIVGLAPGVSHAVRASAGDAYAQGKASVMPAADGSSRVELVLARSASVAVELAFEGGVPASVKREAAILTLERRDDSKSGWTLVKRSPVDLADHLAEGELSIFDRLGAGTYRVTATPSPSQHLAFAFTQPFKVEEGTKKLVRLELGPGAVVSGWVLDAAGELVSSYVEVSFAETAFSFTVNSSEHGFVELRVPPGASLTARIAADGYAETEVAISPGATRLPEVRVARTAK